VAHGRGRGGEPHEAGAGPPGHPWSLPSDEVLCRAAAGGDETAFDVLVERYRARAYRLAWSILRDREEAKDASQEAFLRLYRTAARFEGRARFSTWFYRILVNLCLDQRRRSGWWRRLFGGAEEAEVTQLPAPPDAGHDSDREQRVKQLWQAVDRLSPQQRAVVLLQVQEELPTVEIAAILKCSEATVRVHLHRALTALRQIVGTTRGEI